MFLVVQALKNINFIKKNYYKKKRTFLHPIIALSGIPALGGSSMLKILPK